MQIRSIGTQNVKASQLGLGCMGMSEFYGAGDDSESIRVIHRAIELGCTFLDTADMYGPHTNEMLVGKAIAGKRNKITLATKFGIVRDPQNPTVRKINGRPEYVKAACEASLKRLNVNVIDLYYLHRKDPDTPIEETVGALADLAKEGKIRGIGLSEVSPETLRRAHSTHPISALQTEYSLWSRDPEDELLGLCQELNIGFVAYSPLGRGFLTGKIKQFEDFEPGDIRRSWPRFQGENFQKNLDLVDKLNIMAEQKGCTTSQLALAWIMAQGNYIFPIPGTKRIKYLEENVNAISIQLTPGELDEIDAIAPKNVAAGTRYPEAAMSILNG